MNLLLILALAFPAHAQSTDHETFFMLGWNNNCSVAISHYGFAKLGEAIQDIPYYSNIGTLSIAAGQEAQSVRWYYSTEEQGGWNAEAADKVKKKLRKMGYTYPGFKETIRPAPVVDVRDLPRMINSTDTFRTRSPGPWPGDEWKLSTVYYNTIGTCGLLVYTKRASKEKDSFQVLLVHIDNPGARDDRAISHTTNGRLLLDRNDEDGALAETEIAAVMAPDQAMVRYHHAALLKLTGHMNEAVTELKAAIALDPKYEAKYKSDRDFGAMRGFPDFEYLMKSDKEKDRRPQDY